MRLGAIIGACCVAQAAGAQTLERFLAAARTFAYDARLAEAEVHRRQAEAESAWAVLLPRARIQGSWQYNQFPFSAPFAAAGRTIVIAPRDQWTLVGTLTVPLVDVSGWWGVKAARLANEAGSLRSEAAQIEVAISVTQAFFDLSGSRAVAAANERAVAASVEFVSLTRARREAGEASGVDEARAEAELEARHATRADADRVVADAARVLATLTGMTPGELEGIVPDALHEEAPKEEWLARAPQTPSVQALWRFAQAADENATAAGLQLAPRIVGTANEQITNATGFIGETKVFTGGVGAEWFLDPAIVTRRRVLEATAEGAHVEYEQGLRNMQDRISHEWDLIRAQVPALEAERATAAANALTVSLVRERFRAGSSTSYEVLQADRDKLVAEARVAQREASLLASRRVLRLLSSPEKR